MTPSLSEKRLIDLQIMSSPESAEEMAWLLDYAKWKAAGGVEDYETKRKKELKRQSIANYRLQERLSKLR